ncbi:MAG: RluA family pseudouridine synthase [Azonexus sp.]|nr:RluA family pseudouridine synthase [Azonexus sp.]
MTPYRPPTEAPRFLHIDDDLLIVDKPSGLLSVPGRGPDKADCLVSRVQQTFPDALAVHRLDMSTSGLLVMARSETMHSLLSKLFRDRAVDKTYYALVDGLPEHDHGTIDLPLICDWPNRPRQKVDHEIGKPSLTRYRVLRRLPERHESLIELLPVTGRSHQLRVHLASLGHPILGDELYGAHTLSRSPRLMLHAAKIAFVHPSTGQALEFVSEPVFFRSENAQ